MSAVAVSCRPPQKLECLFTLPRSRIAKKSGIPIWPTASKFLALAVSDCFRRN